MIPLLQPKIAHTKPVGPGPNLLPGTATTQPANAAGEDSAIKAAKMAARIFDFPIAHLVPNEIPVRNMRNYHSFFDAHRL
jgi:hypothetical protein